MISLGVQKDGEGQEQTVEVPAEKGPTSITSSTAVEISLDLPGAAGLDIADILFDAQAQQKQVSSSEEEWENVETGQPVSASKVCGNESWIKRA